MSKHNAKQQQVSLTGKPAAKAPMKAERKSLTPEEALARFNAEVEKAPTATPVEAVMILVDEATRFTAKALADNDDSQLRLFLGKFYLPEFNRRGAVDAVKTFSKLAEALNTTPGQAVNVAKQVLDPTFSPTSVAGKLVGPSQAIANQNGTRSIYQKLDCGTYGTVTAKLIGQSGGYVDDFGFTYSVAE